MPCVSEALTAPGVSYDAFTDDRLSLFPLEPLRVIPSPHQGQLAIAMCPPLVIAEI